MKEDHPTVYSTEWGRMCPRCGKPLAQCVCKKQAARPAGDGVVRVARESKGRGGKVVTLVTGLALDDAGLRALLSELKRQCGGGGTLKDGVIEVQGDHRDLVLAALGKHGIKAKKVG